MLSPTGLWSFATSDNEDGAISQLDALVLKELSNQLRSRNQDEPRLLVLGDKNPFDNGRRGGTREQVEPAFFMIPIITPGYFSGGSQILHFAAFRERENLKLGRQDLIFPIVWIDLRGSDFDLYYKEMVRFEVRAQALDLTKWRPSSPRRNTIERKLAKFVASIVAALERDHTEFSRTQRLHKPRSTSSPKSIPNPRGVRDTAEGRLIRQNRDQLSIQTASLLLLLQSKLTELRAQRPNSDRTRRELSEEIVEYETLLEQLQAVQQTAFSYSNLIGSEEAAVASGKTFAAGVHAWWTKNHEKICQHTFEMALFTAAVSVCSLMGSGGAMVVAVSAALAQGKSIVDAIKAIGTRRISKQSGTADN